LALVLVANEAEAGFELGGRSAVRLEISWLELLIVVLGRLEIGSALRWEGRAGECRWKVGTGFGDRMDFQTVAGEKKGGGGL
jgi:hypothetical protein